MRNLIAASLLCLLIAFSASATVFNLDTTQNYASLTIPNSQHGLNSYRLGVAVWSKSNGVYTRLNDTVDFSYTIDTSTYAVSFNFFVTLPAYSKIRLYGGYDGADTSNGTDFQVTASANTLTVCAQCATTMARHTFNGFKVVEDAAYSGSMQYVSGVYSTVRAYFIEGVLHFGVSTTHTYTTFQCNQGGASGDCIVDYGIGGYPLNSTPLGHAQYFNGYFGAVTDDRQ